VARRAGRAYPEALSEALRGRIADEQLDFDDARARAVLEQTLRTGRPGEVLFALDLLEKAEHPRLESLLAELLEHPRRRCAARSCRGSSGCARRRRPTP